VELQFKLTQEAFEQGMKLHSKQQVKKTWLVLIAIVLAFFFLSTDFSDQKSIVTHVIMSVLFLIFYALLCYFIHRFHTRRQYRTNKIYTDTLHYTFNEEGVKVEHCLGDSFLKWECFGKYIENESTYLLYLSPYLMYILPKSVLDNQEELVFKNYLEDYISDG
jgi:uncharacterized protein YneF (UPF0154 family)